MKKNIFKIGSKYAIIVSINGYNYMFDEIVTLYQALIQKSWYLPRFCYHVKLALAGNCRMCFVDIENVIKPSIACATIISNGLNVYLNSALAYKSRENILEFLLINHPIDCPICDQGGECDLQDQYIIMGSLISRYYEGNKKSVKNKDLSFLIKLSLNKCINCTRCTRYSQNITGEYSFSLLGRGENSVISNYLNTNYVGEITGNVMDLCPVGASTSKIISYDFRLWELIDTKYVDFLDLMHPPIRIDYRGLKILRILPLSNSIIQEEWISDKIRFNFKSLLKCRFYLPYINFNFVFIRISWKASSLFIKNYYFKILLFFSKKKTIFIKNFNFCENTVDLYVYYFYKRYFKRFGFFKTNKLFLKSNNMFRQNFMINDKDLDYLKIDNFIFINLNLRYQYPLLNFKIREKMIFDYSNISVFGFILELNYVYEHIGNNFKALIYFFKNKIKNKFKQAYLLFYCKSKLNLLLNKIIYKVDVQKYDLTVYDNIKLIKKELNDQNLTYLNNFNDLVSVHYNMNNISYDKNFVINNKKLSINLLQNVFNFKDSNFIIPRKFTFEQNSIFLNIFGVYSDYTYMLYRVDYKTLKNDWSLLEYIYIFLKFKKCKLSKIKKFFMPKSWIYNEYNLNIFSYKEAKQKVNFFFYDRQFFNSKTIFFFNDKFSKNNTLIDYFKIIKKKNLFEFIVNINSIHWIF